MSREPETDRDMAAMLERVRRDLAPELDRRVYAEAARRFDREGDLDRAIAAGERVVELDPESAAARFEHAKLLLKAERWREGGRQLEICSDLDSVALAGRHWADNNLYYIAYALFRVGRFKEAAEAFRGAEALIDLWQDPVILKCFHWHQGMAWHLDGKFIEAMESYRRAMVAPGPGDSCDADHMDEDDVEAAQVINDDIAPFMELARKGQRIEDAGRLDVQPAFE